MRPASDHPARCGIILAAGEGKRLQPLVRQLRGDNLPKQYVTFIGRRSMLEHTFDRVERLIPRERTVTVVSQDHLNYPAVCRQLAGRPHGTVIAQPENKDTLPGILLPLMHLYKRHPEATVAVFPSDHFIFEEDLFMSHVATAFQAVERNPSLFVLLGLEPNEVEPEYGYVLPHGATEEKPAGLTLRRVGQFVEKPDRDAARALIGRGGLWNTMVMVFKVQSLLEIVRKIVPELLASFEEIKNALGAPDEADRVRALYRNLSPENFSRGILEKLPSHRPACLSVLSVRGVLWSDWGLPRSIEKVLKMIDYRESLYDPRKGAPATRLWRAFTALGREQGGQRADISPLKKQPVGRLPSVRPVPGY